MSAPLNVNLAKKLEGKYQIVTETGCWIWTGAEKGRGYGSIRYSGRMRFAHRAAYEAYVGEIPEGISVLHKCDTMLCINPAHLFLGTQSDNMLDMWKKQRSGSIWQ